MRKITIVALLIVLLYFLAIPSALAQGPEKQQDLGETHEVWLNFVGQNAVLTFVGKSPTATPVVISIVGGQNVEIGDAIPIGDHHRMYPMHISLSLQPDKECLIFVGNSPDSTPAVWCEGLMTSILPQQ